MSRGSRARCISIVTTLPHALRRAMRTSRPPGCRRRGTPSRCTIQPWVGSFGRPALPRAAGRMASSLRTSSPFLADAFALTEFLRERDDGIVSLHAATVGLPGGVAAIIGDSNVGKTTTAVACARAGMDLYSDERCLIDQRSMIYSFPRAINVRATGLQLLVADEFRGNDPIRARLRAHRGRRLERYPYLRSFSVARSARAAAAACRISSRRCACRSGIREHQCNRGCEGFRALGAWSGIRARKGRPPRRAVLGCAMLSIAARHARCFGAGHP